jgi:hypothetical protein
MFEFAFLVESYGEKVMLVSRWASSDVIEAVVVMASLAQRE